MYIAKKNKKTENVKKYGRAKSNAIYIFWIFVRADKNALIGIRSAFDVRIKCSLPLHLPPHHIHTPGAENRYYQTPGGLPCLIRPATSVRHNEDACPTTSGCGHSHMRYSFCFPPFLSF